MFLGFSEIHRFVCLRYFIASLSNKGAKRGNRTQKYALEWAKVKFFCFYEPVSLIERSTLSLTLFISLQVLDAVSLSHTAVFLWSCKFFSTNVCSVESEEWLWKQDILKVLPVSRATRNKCIVYWDVLVGYVQNRIQLEMRFCFQKFLLRI